jgi:hypothetical protein
MSQSVKKKWGTLAFGNQLSHLPNVDREKKKIAQAYQAQRFKESWAEYHTIWCGPENEDKRAQRRMDTLKRGKPTLIKCLHCGEGG